MNLNNKVVVITGGSKGFGKSLATFLKKENCQVVISSDNSEDLEKVKNKISVDSFLADVTKPEDLMNLGKYTKEKYGRIDIWINNAGIQIAPSLLEDIEVAKLKCLFNINFFGYFYGCQTALKYMKAQRSGLIININSTAGLDGKPMISAYSSSKFAIKGLTESIRKEVGDNINIYAVYPGGMQTDIYQEKIPDDISEYMLVDDVVQKVIDNLNSDNPNPDLIIKRPIIT
ncbi:MAG: SDR family oxidoreductase [Patescibacteria group bacterium]|jgi:NAD(P)-dependent dehydrogenase (short-subunit alcohol dehydrogenase family)